MYVMSQAAANVVRLNLFPDLDAPSTVNFGAIVCPAYRFDTITVRNRGTGPLYIYGSSGFQGPNALYYRLTSPVLPDTIQPGGLRQFIIRFDGIISGNTMKLVMQDDTGHGRVTAKRR